MSLLNPDSRRALFILAGLAPFLAAAQLPVARLAQVFPPGGAVGSTVDVAVAGSDLDEPARLHFSHPGIVGTPTGEGTRFSVAVASNVPPGVHEVRFVGRFGISNPRAFVVSRALELVAPATNTSPAAAMEWPSAKTSITVNGRVTASAVAWFRFQASAGRRCFLECLAQSIDSRLDATLILADAAGRELQRSRRSGLLDFTPPTDGTWLVGVADFLYRGGPDYFFRLTLSQGPRIEYLFPPAGLPGATTNFTVYGYGLPGGKPVPNQPPGRHGLEELSVTLTVPQADATRLDTGLYVPPGEAALDGFEYRVSAPSDTSNPWLVGIASAPVVLEAEPNNTPAKAQQITPPCEIAGQFFPAGDVDTFRFEAKKGDVFWIEVISARLGLPTDPFVLVQRVTRDTGEAEKTSDVLELYDSDTNLGDREFNTTSRDPAARFEASESGEYRVTVRDLFGRNTASPRHVYRLALRRPAPDFRLVALAVVPRLKADAKNIELGVPFLRRGETIALRVVAFRRDGFNGDIDLSLENPPPGLVFSGDRIESGKNADFILLTAAEDAPAFAGPLRLVGRARVGDQELVREARAGTLLYPVPSFDSERPESRMARALTLGITDRELAPVSIAPVTNQLWDVRTGAKLKIPLAITRRGDFNAALKLKPLGPGNQESLKEFDVEAKGTNATLNLDFAALKLSTGSHVFAVQTTTTGKYLNNPDGAARAETDSKETAKRLLEEEAALKQAGEDLDKATRTATAAETAAKSAAEKKAAAQTAADKSPDDESLKTALAAADAAATEAATKAKEAAGARAAAEKAKTAEQSAVKAAKAKKEAAAARAKELNDKAKAKDVTVVVHSQPIRVRVLAAEQASK